MPAGIDRAEVVRLVAEEGAQLVEVLPETEYEWAHLPEAQHLPLGAIDIRRPPDAIDPRRPVIVYCNDFL